MDSIGSTKIARRQFLSLSAGFGLAAGLAAGGWGSIALAAEGGVLSTNMKDLPNFDITSNATSWVALTMGPCYNGLLRQDPTTEGGFTPELATEWVVSDDYRTVTFKLREGVTFHDGQPFTSADVRATFEHTMSPGEGGASPRQNLLAAVASIDTPDDHTVVFNLSFSQPSFLPILATAWMVILPKHILDRDGNMQNAVIGTGPFKLKEYQRGVRLDLVKNEEYFEPGQPVLDGITFFVAEDPSTLDAYFKTGQIQLYNEMSSDSGLRFEPENDWGVTVQRVVNPNPTALTLNARVAPFDDIRVRQAVSYAIDRQESINVLEQGQGVIGGFIPPGRFAMSDEDLRQLPGYGENYEQNLASAKALLAEAGFTDGFECKMLVRKNTGHEERAVLAQGQLARVGIKMTLEVQESAMFFENFNAKNFAIASQGGIAYPVHDPDIFFTNLHTDSEGNVAGVVNPKIDELNEQQRAELDPEKRRLIAQEMDKIALTECGRIVLFYQNKFVGVSKKISGYTATNNPDDAGRLATLELS